MTVAVIPAQIIEYATAEELADAQRFVRMLSEFGDDDYATEWSVGEVWSIRPNAQTDGSNMEFIKRIHRLARSMRQLQRQQFEVEIDMSTDYERRPDRTITACLLTIRWPRRPLVLEMPDLPAKAKPGRGTSHTDRRRNRA